MKGLLRLSRGTDGTHLDDDLRNNEEFLAPAGSIG